MMSWTFRSDKLAAKGYSGNRYWLQLVWCEWIQIIYRDYPFYFESHALYQLTKLFGYIFRSCAEWRKKFPQPLFSLDLFLVRSSLPFLCYIWMFAQSMTRVFNHFCCWSLLLTFLHIIFSSLCSSFFYLLMKLFKRALSRILKNYFS